MRKYFTEFGLNVFTSYKTIVPVEHLEKVQRNAKYHIYGILSIPRVIIDKESFIVNKEGFKCTLKGINPEYQESYEISNFSMLPGIDHREIKYDIRYPFDKLDYHIDREILLNFFNNNKERINFSESEFLNLFDTPLDIQLVLNKHLQENWLPLKMEVLYIGKSFGANGQRLAQDRLSAHSTLQKILTDFHSKYPDKRIYLLLLEMTPLLNTTFDGISQEYGTSDEEDQKHLEKVLSNLPVEEQVINITEAAIINYFKPYYNTNFIENFPSTEHTGYKQYYDLDYNCMSVELDLEFDSMPNIELHTDNNNIKNCWEFIQYNLSNDPNRRNMYEIFTSKAE
ncbi:hypothetical protein [Paenibacillus typhae]|uniref:Uncharacterized protein n=2 Tax=Paenibacillus typhae TaxID=1174501 RepID=A0A1G8Y1X2_9BACL|nr:hypothetical protein [Paenibacillus typhae]SDJ96776.1 hypothetical protein SAMN05216192_12818 [Paenibacillus typhae]